MYCLVLFSLLFLPVVHGVVQLETSSTTASISIPTNVNWSRDSGDSKIFDLRFVSVVGGNSNSETDAGYAATVNATDGSLTGVVPVTFNQQGQFVLKAIDYNNGNQVLASSSTITVGSGSAVAAASSATSTTAVSTSQPSPTAATSGALSSSSSSTPNASSSSPSKSSSSHPHVAAIVGGVLGAIVILLLIAVLVFVKCRRQPATIKKRMTFKSDLMVSNRQQQQQQRTAVPDLENGHGNGFAHNGNGTYPNPNQFQIQSTSGYQPATATIPTPRGGGGGSRTNPPPPPLRPRTPIEHPPTLRQIELGTRIVQIEHQMAGIKRQNRGQGGGTRMEPVLEQMRRQVDWLRMQREGPWARGETDVSPPLLEYYMES